MFFTNSSELHQRFISNTTQTNKDPSGPWTQRQKGIKGSLVDSSQKNIHNNTNIYKLQTEKQREESREKQEIQNVLRRIRETDLMQTLGMFLKYWCSNFKWKCYHSRRLWNVLECLFKAAVDKRHVAQWASALVLIGRIRGAQVQTPLQSACRSVPETLHPKVLLWRLPTVLSM